MAAMQGRGRASDRDRDEPVQSTLQGRTFKDHALERFFIHVG